MTALQQDLLTGIGTVQRSATSSRLSRLLHSPLRYVSAIGHRKLTYKRTRREKRATCKTFFGVDMQLQLPSGTDIYLTGGKSHDSEIRLAKYLIRTLSAGDTFIDVGAHYGYFSLLASTLIGSSGHVHALEASPTSYRVLEANLERRNNCNVHNAAVSDTMHPLTFYEFPNLYSEYNSLDISQFKDEKWFALNPPESIQIKSIQLAAYIADLQLSPKLIKIDVEGAEYKVIRGLEDYLANTNPTIIIEFLNESRGNTEHLKAAELLYKHGYRAHLIDEEGLPCYIASIQKHLFEEGIDSDNIAFIKQILV